MRLTAVTVSVNYPDFLEHTIENKKLLDRWIIVTDSKDTRTQKICKDAGVEVVVTDVFYENGAKFNKYAGINEGLKLVGKDEWVIFLDSDILLDKSTRRVLESIKLDESCMYGMDRLNVKGIEEFNRYKAGPGMLSENWLLNTQGLEMGARLVHHYGQEGERGRFEGYRPLGYFQMCHHNYFETYPDNTLGADNCDLVFARQWPRHKRILIPEIYCLHLETKGAHKAINWYGRKSEHFDPQRAKELYDAIGSPVTKHHHKPHHHHHHHYYGDGDMKVKLVTMASDLSHPGLKQLKRSLDKFGWAYEVLDINYQWFGSKMVAAYEYAKQTDCTHLFLVDAYDVFVLGDMQEALSKIPNKDILLFNAENNCYPDKGCEDKYPKIASKWRYLNAGVSFISVKRFIKMYEENPIKHTEDDQRRLTEIYLEKRDEYNMQIDSNCEVFQSVYKPVAGDFILMNGRLLNDVNKTTPVIIHGNGRGTSMSSVYNLLK